MDKDTDDYQHQDVSQTLQALETDPEHGLSTVEVRQRLERYGYNEIQEQEEPLWHRIFRRFWGPIPWMIEIAALLSAAVQKWEDFTIIFIMLLVNGLLDFFQEHRALNALAALKQKLTQEVTVLRDGEFRSIPARELVPGDIIRLKIGDVIPADVQLIDGEYLSIDQSALTGESLPVSKRRNDVAYANTIVKQGEMHALVINTGPRTRFHAVVALVAKASLQERSHFQQMVIKIGNFLIFVTLALVTLIILVSLFRHEDLLEILRFAMVLTVAAIPVALPAVLSVTMAVGALNLARRQAIVSRLTAIEELAGVDVFCSDKTGTLTRNQMQVAEPVVFDGHDQAELFLHALLASRPENRDPIELPLFHHVDQHFPDLPWKEYRQVEFIPFDPIRKRTEAVLEKDGRRFRALKGAAQILLDMAELSDNERVAITRTVEVLASKGYRTLAVARQEGEAPLELIGLIPLFDPPREDSREVIEVMREYGVRVKMVTGDNAAIAREIGQMLGLEPRVMRAEQISGKSGTEIIDLAEALSAALYRKLHPGVTMKAARDFADGVIEEMQKLFDTSLIQREFVHTHESALIDMIEATEIFAEVVPEDKYLLVEKLQKAGHIVGMTGDGVNDAPALKKADCGFAVSNATDAARAAADIILTAPGLSVIDHAIEQARITFERMKSYAVYRIAETIRVLLFMTLSIVVFNFYPVTAFMIVILALLNDIPILSIAYDNTRVQQHPVRWNMTELLSISSILGVAGVASSFLLFFILEELEYPEPFIQSVIFCKLIVAGHLTIFVTRTEDWMWKRPYPSALLLHAGLWSAVLGTLISVYGWWVEPIGWTVAGYIWLYALVWGLFNDAVKKGAIALLRRENWYA
ncbi:plasma-membrane proton-efflux P-type ATPase [Thiohalobacter sp. IOR34]|uniref:plasma-membrane proton-efflux P-type ATPase n=1 Tax=Thiohalobacter sp. IOR34 TaxID=3057176 RepID=UPI0025B05DFC|nr:plasma-membrane proton-efflux P-type ATPase [Thiohalobacter sp. IOR34]WJW76354.1 plasma-membrane proton-efflux P-type ATPase [Thiohalobacter sp. IOR34]